MARCTRTLVPVVGGLQRAYLASVCGGEFQLARLKASGFLTAGFAEIDSKKIDLSNSDDAMSDNIWKFGAFLFAAAALPPAT
jgi:hypothetical protein